MNSKQHFEDLKAKYKLQINFTIYKKLIKIKAKNKTLKYLKVYVDDIKFSDYYYANYQIILMHICFPATYGPYNKLYLIRHDEITEIANNVFSLQFILTPKYICAISKYRYSKKIHRIYNKIVPEYLNAIQISPYYLYCKGALNCNLRISI